MAIGLGVTLALCASGCRSSGKKFCARLPVTSHASEQPGPAVQTVAFLARAQSEADSAAETTAGVSSASAVRVPTTSEREEVAKPFPATLKAPLQASVPQPANVSSEQPQPLELETVVASVRNHFPLIQQVAAGRAIASGQALSASGAFDHKIEGFSESQPLDFYENYRHSFGVKRETTWGGTTYAGYRVGRGIFEPWYLERETNKGGEFKLGFIAPVGRDRWIDANRAELWKAQLERRRVEPEILAQVIRSVRNGSVAYWSWVAAGMNHRIAEGLLKLAEQRTEGLEAQVEAGEKAQINLVDNRRIIASREAKVIDARRKLQQSAIKLSLFFRSEDGEPVLSDVSLLPWEFPTPSSAVLLEADFQLALAQRPELAELQIIRRQLAVALRQACNETRPDIDAGLKVAQDIGEPTSAKRDKSELELEARLTLAVPLQRRKAMGKIRSLRGKVAQVTAKTRFTSDKIVADVQIAFAALTAARERVDRVTESYRLAIKMQAAEQELFDQGQSTLFNLNLREKQAAEAASERAEVMLEYYIANADYAAALGSDFPSMQP